MLETTHLSRPTVRADVTPECRGAVRLSPFSAGRAALGFWLASLGGFTLHGWLIALSAMQGLGEPAAGTVAEGAAAALALGLVEAVVLGVPMALVFAALRQRARLGAEWPAALAAGALLSAALYLPLRSCATAVADFGYARVPAITLAVAVTTAMAGAVAGNLGGRGRHGRPAEKAS